MNEEISTPVMDEMPESLKLLVEFWKEQKEKGKLTGKKAADSKP